MPYSLKGLCVIRTDTGQTIKCHRTRARALRHLAALQINVSEAKALPSSQSGGSGLSRSEAAIEAWKHRQRAAPKPGGLDPKIAARVKEILAAKQKGKAKAKPKGKAAKPKETRTKQEKANQNRAGVAKQAGMGDLEGTLVRLNAGMQGAGMENDKHDALIKKGLAQRHADGSVSLSPAGKKWKSAADKGDADAASAALSDAKTGAVDRAAKEQEHEKAKAERVTAAAAKKQEREKAKVERVAAQAGKQQATLKKQNAAAQIAKEKVKAGDAAKQAKEKSSAQAKVAKEQSQAAVAKEKVAAPANKQAENRAKVAQEMAEQDAGLAPSGAAALGDFADGKPLKPETATAFEEMGLTEKDEAGNHRLTTEGRAAAAAMSKGDTRAAIDAISRAGDKKKAKGDSDKAKAARTSERDKAKADVTAKRIEADKAKTEAQAKRDASTARVEAARIEAARNRKAVDMTDLAIKAGARHSRMDLQHIQAIHDSAVACGADCAPDDGATMPDDEEEEGVKAIKGIMDNPLYYAQHECQDIMQAANALSTMAMLIQSELVEEDEDTQHIAMLCDAAHTLVDFIDSELDELEQAGKDAAHDASMGPMKAITAREDVNPKAGVTEYGAVAFADMKNKKYPIDTADHVRAAWNYIAKEANAAKYDPDEVSQIKAKIVAAWKKLIDKAGPPSAGKALDDAWLHIDGDAIKSLDNDMIRGYAVRFGDADHADLQHDYYTKATDFWLDHFGWPRPITYHHGMDAGTRNDPVIGHWLKAGVDDVGVWMEGQMDRAHAYYKAMKELAQRGYLRLSSDSAPQWVVREKQQNGINEIKRWPLVTASCTVTPMEPRMVPVEVKAYLAEIGIDIDDSTEAIKSEPMRRDDAEMDDETRSRMLLLELDLIELETA